MLSDLMTLRGILWDLSDPENRLQDEAITYMYVPSPSLLFGLQSEQLATVSHTLCTVYIVSCVSQLIFMGKIIL